MKREKLIPLEVLAAMPGYRATEEVAPEKKIVPLKFFTPWAGWTWYAVEVCEIYLSGYEGVYSVADLVSEPERWNRIEDVVFFGYVVSGLDPTYSEWGSFSLADLESAKGPHGLTIERDLYWTPKPFGEIR